MKIRPRNILAFQYGGGVPQWYLDRYGNRTALLGWDLNKRYNYANQNLNTNDHRNAGNLDTVYRKNIAYTGTPSAISSDILNFYNSDGKGMSAEDFVNFYNSNAAKIRSHWALDLTYNAKTAGEHNRLFKRMFASRSNLSMNPGSDYNIGYLDNLEDTEGSSTWLRRMDQYEKEFDPNNPDSNRVHEIILSDGSKALVYKKANGDIGLIKPQQETPLQQETPQQLEIPEELKTGGTQVPTGHLDKYGFDWNKLREGALRIFSNPNLYAFGRLAGNLINNERVYDEALKGIKPTLLNTYRTHRQVVGDEATKLAYYRRAAQGQTKAALPFTSDADRQMAYLFEAKRIGDELRALGDLADNQEIRRTSDESNQHQWDNIKRATEVANTNSASRIQANALRHNLLALKHSALWSSIDNFLQEIEYRKRQQVAESLALDDLIFNLGLLLDLLYNDELLQARKDYQAVLEKYKDDPYNDAVLEAKRKYQAVLNKLTIEAYQKKKEYLRNRNLLSAKSGTKITHKKKDDLLYKSTRDVVEHFRRMSKISSDSYNRRTPKILKLTSHPKSRKYQLGGVAPFTIYKPVALGGETTLTYSLESGSSSSKSSKKEGSDTLDMIKELFKSLVGKGLPSDVNSLYTSMLKFLARALAFGEEISTEDIASMYLLQMLRINQILYLKTQHDAALQSVVSNDAVNEFAVDFAGRLVGQKDGQIVYANSWNDAIEKGITPITNGQLLHLRAISPSLAGQTELDLVAANGIGMSKIALFLKSQLPSLGFTLLDNTIEGYTKKDSNDIILGLQLLKLAPEGDYKYTKSLLNKDLLRLANKAIEYLSGILPNNMKTVLNIKALQGGISVSDLIGSLISSEMNFESKSKLEFDAVTGKAANKGLGSGGDGDVLSNPLLAMLREIGGTPINYSLITRDSNTKMSVDGTNYSSLPKVKDDMSIDNMLSVSGIDGILDSKYGITFGDLIINPENLKDIMYSNSGNNVIVTLPCKIVNGHKVVNLAVREAYEKAEAEALQIAPRNSEKFLLVLGEKLKETHLDSLLNSNGYPNKNMFMQFLIVEAYTSDKVNILNKNSQYIEKINADSTLEARMNKALSTDSKKSNYNLDVKDKWTLFELRYNDIYRGSVFIPLNNNPNAAINSWGGTTKIGQSTELEELYLISNKSALYVKNNSF